MMDEKKDGGPAFPVHEENDDGIFTATKGMSLRDWFAGQALQGLIAAHKTGMLRSDDAVFHAYAFADAMIERRKP
jgi:uncharacterized protein YodC (DUF2158 family)